MNRAAASLSLRNHNPIPGDSALVRCWIGSSRLVIPFVAGLSARARSGRVRGGRTKVGWPAVGITGAGASFGMVEEARCSSISC